MDCSKCTNSINNESDDYFECDGCWAVLHVKCVGVKKSEVTARKNSKFLKLYCEKCYADPGRLMADNVQTILKYVCKIDMVSQKQHENNKNVEMMMKRMNDDINDNNTIREIIKEHSESIKGHIDECGAKLHAVLLNETQTQGQGVSGNGDNNKTPTYASVVSASTKSLIVRPKNKENNSEKTKQMLMSVVDPTASSIKEIKTLSNGSVLIRCKTNEAVEVIEKQVKEKEGENYSMRETTGGAKMKVKLVGMARKYSNEELTSLIQKQHLNGDDAYVRVVKVYADKNTQEESFNAIIDFDTKTAENVLNAKQISVAWDMCKVFSYVRIGRCFKCLGYNHLAKDCKNKIACSKCGGEHKVDVCTSNELSCVNCVEYAKKNNENIDTKHHAFAHKCYCTQQILHKISKNNNRKE